jgi:cytosine/adenosine deaminase-related metal-dependent hydrolase
MRGYSWPSSPSTTRVLPCHTASRGAAALTGHSGCPTVGTVPERRIVIRDAAIATMDPDGTEFGSGHVVVENQVIAAAGPGPAPGFRDGVPAEHIDGSGHLLTPGLVNTHHHFYQWLTRGLAQEASLFEWLTALYPVWGRIDEAMTYAAARASASSLLRSGCTTAADHHYIFPAGAGDLLGAEIRAARGAMDLGQSAGGLPPDFAVEEADAALAAAKDAIDAYHDPSPGAMTRVGVAPCSPFSVTAHLMRGSAELARSHGVRLHTHGAETLQEEQFCAEKFGCSPAEYLDGLGWLAGDVWLAHCVHLDGSAIRRLGETGTGVAHCPSSNARLGSGIAPVPELLDANVPVGLGVDGTASNESGQLGTELRAAVLFARARRGATALTARQALRMATLGGARCLGRDGETGSIEPGKLADLALWRIDDAEHSTIADPVAALVLGALPPLTLLLVGGEPVVRDGHLTAADEDTVGRDAAAQARRLLAIAGQA